MQCSKSVWIWVSVVVVCAIGLAVGLGVWFGTWDGDPMKGHVWPKPQQYAASQRFFLVRADNFTFQVTNNTCDILDAALARYTNILKRQERIRRHMKEDLNNYLNRNSVLKFDEFEGYLDTLEVELMAPCEALPYLNMDEHYELRVNSHDLPDRAVLTSQSIWGILRGLETWSQLIVSTGDATALIINSTSILDFPRFTHRGLHLDTARHFIPMRLIVLYLEAMAMNKFNVFHWHIVDDQSFPYESLVYPRLTSEGAYAPTHIYTQEEIKVVIEEARLRGIRVVVEFDTPGHTRSWGNGYPELLTECYSNGQPDGSLGPMNPILNSTYTFMQNLLQEIEQVFPDDFIHVGGDEVPFECWQSNPDIQSYMRLNNLTVTQLEEVYIAKVLDMVTKQSRKSIVWQEVFDNGVEIQEGTVVHVWKVNGDYMGELAKVTKAGYSALLSSCWYMDHLSSGGDWRKFYDCDPYFFTGTEEQRRRVLGGEACMWSEVVDANNLMSRVWPRASATAEKLWSQASADDPEDAAKRLEEHTCRMNRRGIAAQPPNGPGFCIDVNYT